LLSRPGAACDLTLTPETATNLVAETHTVTAQLIDTAGGAAETSTAITFEIAPAETGTVIPIDQTNTVTVPPGETSTVEILSETTTTNAEGWADFSFTSSAEGAFMVTATFTNVDGEVETATALKTFMEEIDAAAPAFASATAFDGTNTMLVGYSEPLDCGSVDSDGSDYSAEITIGAGNGTTVVPEAASCDGALVTLTFPNTPFSNQEGTVGTVTAGGVLDLAGNAQADDTVGFTTVPAPA